MRQLPLQRLWSRLLQLLRRRLRQSHRRSPPSLSNRLLLLHPLNLSRPQHLQNLLHLLRQRCLRSLSRPLHPQHLQSLWHRSHLLHPQNPLRPLHRSSLLHQRHLRNRSRLSRLLRPPSPWHRSRQRRRPNLLHLLRLLRRLSLLHQ
ncbi:MAG TPA: hypothetical protein VF420_07660 [Casimicrobiaceae bacterium]